jgi:GNAT superfamily N-acetyltransferase
MSIRPFTEKDRPSLRDIYLTTRKHSFEWLDPQSLNESDFDRDTAGEKIWVAENSSQIVGFVSVWEADSFVHHLFVLPEFSNLGYGSRLLEACLEYINGPAQLKCVVQNTVAMTFYRAKGWQTVSKGISSEGEYYLMRSGE